MMISVVQMMISVFNRSENIMGKGESGAYQHFLLLPECLQKPCFPSIIKILECLGMVMYIIFTDEICIFNNIII